MSLFGGSKKSTTNQTTNQTSNVLDTSGDGALAVVGGGNIINTVAPEIVSNALSFADRAISSNEGKFETLVDAAGNLFGGYANVTKEAALSAIKSSDESRKDSLSFGAGAMEASYEFSGGAVQESLSLAKINQDLLAKQSNLVIDKITAANSEAQNRVQDVTKYALEYNAGLITTALDTVTQNSKDNAKISTDLVTAGIASVKEASKSASETLATSLSETSSKTITIVVLGLAGLAGLFFLVRK